MKVKICLLFVSLLPGAVGQADDALKWKMFPHIPSDEECLTVLNRALLQKFQPFFRENNIKLNEPEHAGLLMFKAMWNQEYQQVEEVAILWGQYRDDSGKERWLLASFGRSPHSRIDEDTVGWFEELGTGWQLQADNVDFDPDVPAPVTHLRDLPSVTEGEVQEMLELMTMGGFLGTPTRERLKNPEEFRMLQVEWFLESINPHLEKPLTPRVIQEFYSLMESPGLGD